MSKVSQGILSAEVNSQVGTMCLAEVTALKLNELWDACLWRSFSKVKVVLVSQINYIECLRWDFVDYMYCIPKVLSVVKAYLVRSN